jgi:hypothetical protein
MRDIFNLGHLEQNISNLLKRRMTIWILGGTDCCVELLAYTWLTQASYMETQDRNVYSWLNPFADGRDQQMCQEITGFRDV